MTKLYRDVIVKIIQHCDHKSRYQFNTLLHHFTFDRNFGCLSIIIFFIPRAIGWFHLAFANVNTNLRGAQITKLLRVESTSSDYAIDLKQGTSTSACLFKLHGHVRSVCTPHYQSLENHRLRRGPHVVARPQAPITPLFIFFKLFTATTLFSPKLHEIHHDT